MVLVSIVYFSLLSGRIRPLFNYRAFLVQNLRCRLCLLACVQLVGLMLSGFEALARVFWGNELDTVILEALGGFHR